MRTEITGDREGWREMTVGDFESEKWGHPFIPSFLTVPSPSCVTHCPMNEPVLSAPLWREEEWGWVGSFTFSFVTVPAPFIAAEGREKSLEDRWWTGKWFIGMGSESSEVNHNARKGKLRELTAFYMPYPSIFPNPNIWLLDWWKDGIRERMERKCMLPRTWIERMGDRSC